MHLLFDPNRRTGCCTQARKGLATRYPCFLDCVSVPVWAECGCKGDLRHSLCYKFTLDVSHDIIIKMTISGVKFKRQNWSQDCVSRIFYCINPSFLRVSHFVKEVRDISSKPASHPKHDVIFIVNAKVHLKNEQNADRTVSPQKKRSDR